MTKNKLYSAVLSVLTAFGLWLYVVNNVSVMDTIPFYNVPVALEGRALLNCGDETATEIDHEVMKMLAEAYKEAKALLSQHREAMDRIADHLIRKETITGKEFMQIYYQAEGIDPDAAQKARPRIEGGEAIDAAAGLVTPAE